MIASKQVARTKQIHGQNVFLFGNHSSLKSPALLLKYFDHYRSQDKSYYTTFRMLRVRNKWMRKVFAGHERLNCWLCGCSLTKENSTLDHVIPLRDGGGWNDTTNFRLAHSKCNRYRDFIYPESLPNASLVPLTKTQIRAKKRYKNKIREYRKNDAKFVNAASENEQNLICKKTQKSSFVNFWCGLKKFLRNILTFAAHPVDCSQR